MPSYRHIRAVQGRCITVLYCSVQYGVHLQLYRVEMLTPPPPTDCCILLPSDGCINDSFISLFFLGIFKQSLNFSIRRQINFFSQSKTMTKEYQQFIRGSNCEIKNLVTLPLESNAVQ